MSGPVRPSCFYEVTKTLLTSDGSVLSYGSLVATGALDKLVAMTAGAPRRSARLPRS